MDDTRPAPPLGRLTGPHHQPRDAYELGCGWLELGRTDTALFWFDKAMALGYADAAARYHALLGLIRQQLDPAVLVEIEAMEVIDDAFERIMADPDAPHL